jgi:hypothetical protein
LPSVRRGTGRSHIFVRIFGISQGMKRDQLIRLLSRDARVLGLALVVDMARGKGGHCVVRVEGRFSVIKSGEITPLMEKVIRKQLGL